MSRKLDHIPRPAGPNHNFAMNMRCRNEDDIGFYCDRIEEAEKKGWYLASVMDYTHAESDIEFLAVFYPQPVV